LTEISITAGFILIQNIENNFVDTAKLIKYFLIFLTFETEMDSTKLNALILSLRNGEKKAFCELYNDFFGVLYHLSIHYLQDASVSEEIVQDTFMKLWDIRETLNERFNIRNFLYTITKNNCLNYIRNQKIVLKHLERFKYLEMQFNYEALEKMGNYAEFEELRLKIDQVIASLPDDLRETFLLSRYDEMHYREIAEKLEISVKTVEARMTKVLKFLRLELKEYMTLMFLITDLFS
jgi:RNA polymerase sigma-70 factor, ECF subfamily